MILRYLLKLSPLLLFYFVAKLYAAWTPPVGIPHPPFGITNSHWDLTNYTYDFGTGAVSYPIGPNGPYTHYIDNAHPSATDTANPFGSPSRPRLSGDPSTATYAHQGNIIEYAGGQIQAGVFSVFWRPVEGGNTLLGTNNSATQPTYVRGSSWATRPMFRFSDHRVAGNYVIFENLCFTNDGSGGIQVAGKYYVSGGVTQHVNNIVFRSNEMVSFGGNLGNGAFLNFGDTDPTPANLSNNAAYANWMHHGGTTNQAVENDYLGVKVIGDGVYHTFVLDNHIHHMGGDGVALGSNPYVGHPYPGESRFTYIGRNNLHHNGENSVDVKVTWDTVISQNSCYSNWQHAIVVHYNGENGWIIGNEIHDNNANHVHNPAGISNTGFVDLYVIGNVFYDLDSAIEGTSANAMRQGNNTFVRCGTGSYAAFGTNNLFNNIYRACSSAINYDTASANVSAVTNCWFNPVFSVLFASSTYTTLGSLPASFQACATNEPMFVDELNNNFSVTNTSAAAGAASINHQQGTTNEYGGFFGLSFQTSVDPGAYPQALAMMTYTSWIGSDGTNWVANPPPRTIRAGRVTAGRVNR